MKTAILFTVENTSYRFRKLYMRHYGLGVMYPVNFLSLYNNTILSPNRNLLQSCRHRLLLLYTQIAVYTYRRLADFEANG